MNRLSATGGGVLYLGAYFGGNSVQGGVFNTFNLVGEVAALPPTISSVSPNAGSRGGGTEVTVTGANLTGATAVSFGGGVGSGIIVDSATQLRVTTPARWDGTFDVTVATPGGSATQTSAYTFVSPSVAITSPAQGGALTNGNVTVTGTAANATSVTVFLNFVGQGSVPVVNGAWSKVLSGALGNGAYTVAAEATDGRVPSPIVTAAFSVAVPTPQIFDRQPTGGAEEGGFPVVITGAGFNGATWVGFGATAATRFTVDNDGQITAIAPPGTGHVDINVTTPAGGSGTGSSATSFLYVASPTISAISPSIGATTGSPTVTITGTNLSDATDVTFGGMAATIVGSPTATSITVTRPAHAAGAVDVVVFTPNGPATATGGYTYIAAPTISTISPNAGPTSGPYTITIAGANLGDATSVVFGGVPGAIIGRSANELTVLMPALYVARTVDVVVTTPGGTATAANGFTAADTPTITRVSPNEGDTTSNATVTISGANLAGATSVFFGGMSATIVGAPTATAITVTAPPQVAGPVDVIVTTPGGTATANRAYLYTTPQPTISSVSPNVGPTAGGQNVTVTGTELIVLNATVGGEFTLVNASTGTEAYLVTPAHAPGVVDVVLLTPNGTVTLRGGYTYADAPVATSGVHGGLISYNSGSATATSIDLSSRVTNIPTRYAAGSATTAQGGTVTITDAGLASYIPPVGFRGGDSFTFTASNAAGSSSTAMLSLEVGPPTFTVTLPETAGAVGIDYNPSNSPVIISGGIAPYRVVSVTGYPHDLSFDVGAQVLSGKVTETGTWTIAFTIADSSTGAGSFIGTVSAILITGGSPAPTADAFTTPSVAYNTGSASATTIDTRPHTGGLITGYWLDNGVGVAGTTTTTAHGGSATINTFTGQVRYTAPVGFRGDDSFQYQAINTGGVAVWATVTVPVSDPVFTVTLPDATGQVGAPYNSGGAAVTVSGGAAPYSGFSATGLPAGLTMNAAGVISGTPTTAASPAVMVTLTDSSAGAGSHTSTASASLTIGAPTITLTPAAGTLPAGVGGTFYSQTLTATGGQGAHRFALASGRLPTGLSLSPDGLISGTPTAAGAFDFAVEASDASPAPGPFVSAAVDYSITVAGPTITLTPAAGALSGGSRTMAYSQTFTASGGAPDYGYEVTAGVLPAGLVLTTQGVLSGVPTTAGSGAFTVTATDAHGFTQSAAYTLDVGTPVAVVQSRATTVVGGHSVTIDAAQGSTGLDLIEARIATEPTHGKATVNGLIITYTAEGSYAGQDSFTYTASNPGGVSAPATVTVTVNPAVATGPEKTVTILAGQTAVVELTDSAFGAPFTQAAVVSVAPDGAGVATIAARTGADGSQLYDLSFKPDKSFVGTATVLYTLSNAFMTSEPGTVTITVEARPDPTQDRDVSGLISAQGAAARRFATAQISNVNRRLERLHDGGDGRGFSSTLNLSSRGGLGARASNPDDLRRMQDVFGVIDGLTGQKPDDPEIGRWSAAAFSPASLSSTGLSAAERGANLETGDDREQGAWGLWVSGAATFGRADDGLDREGFKFTTDGLTIGTDRRLGAKTVFGAAVSWATDTSEIGDNGTRSDAEGWSLAAYGSWQPATKTYLDVVLGYGRLDFDSLRYVMANSEVAFGRRDGDQWFGAITAGANFSSLKGVRLAPYGRIEATRSILGAFTEEGGGAYALAYDEQAMQTVTGALGLRGDYAFARRFGQAMSSFRIEYSYDLQGTGTQRIRYADWLDGNVYSLGSSPLDRNRILYGLGLDILRVDGMRLGLDYEGMLSSDQTSGTFRFEFEAAF